jgi:vacuolar-type H+-ATPase subunit I/STV1
MKALIIPALATALFTSLSSFSSPVLAQDDDADTESVEVSERVERIRALRQELREEVQAEQQSRREALEQRLANLSEDERAALRERRQMMRQQQARRADRLRGQRRSQCDCPDAEAETETQN